MSNIANSIPGTVARLDRSMTRFEWSIRHRMLREMSQHGYVPISPYGTAYEPLSPRAVPHYLILGMGGTPPRATGTCFVVGETVGRWVFGPTSVDALRRIR